MSEILKQVTIIDRGVDGSIRARFYSEIKRMETMGVFPIYIANVKRVKLGQGPIVLLERLEENPDWRIIINWRSTNAGRDGGSRESFNWPK